MVIANKPREIAECVAIFLKNGDLEGVVSMFHPDCQIFFPIDAPPKQGLEGAREAFKDFIAMKPILTSTVNTEIINGDTALLQADWKLLTEDGQLIADGSSTEVAKKLENGGWGYFIDCPNGPPLI